jgi:hypothetical protein
MACFHFAVPSLLEKVIDFFFGKNERAQDLIHE